MATVNEKMTAIADAIRIKTGGTEALTLDEMASDLNAIANRTVSDLTASGATVTVPAGNYKTQATKPVATAIQATPSISINSSGLITATATQTAGYVSAGTESGTKQLTTQAAKTVTPTKSSQTAVASGVYTTGAVTVGAIPSDYITTSDANAVVTDILSGKTAYVNGSKLTGTMTNNGAISKTMDGVTIKSTAIPAGYTSGGTVSMDSTVDNAVTAAIIALTDKGVTVPDGTNVTGLADLIAAIEAGGVDMNVVTGTFTPVERVSTYEIEHGLGVIPKVILLESNISGVSLDSSPISGEVITVSYAHGYMTCARYVYSAGGKFYVYHNKDYDITTSNKAVTSAGISNANETTLVFYGLTSYFQTTRTYCWVIMG